MGIKCHKIQCSRCGDILESTSIKRVEKCICRKKSETAIQQWEAKNSHRSQIDAQTMHNALLEGITACGGAEYLIWTANGGCEIIDLVEFDD